MQELLLCCYSELHKGKLLLGSILLSCTFRGASHIKASASKTFFCRGRPIKSPLHHPFLKLLWHTLYVPRWLFSYLKFEIVVSLLGAQIWNCTWKICWSHTIRWVQWTNLWAWPDVWFPRKFDWWDQWVVCSVLRQWRGHDADQRLPLAVSIKCSKQLV